MSLCGVKFPSTRHSQRTTQGQETLIGSHTQLDVEILGVDSLQRQHLGYTSQPLWWARGLQADFSIGLKTIVCVWTCPSHFSESPVPAQPKQALGTSTAGASCPPLQGRQGTKAPVPEDHDGALLVHLTKHWT